MNEYILIFIFGRQFTEFYSRGIVYIFHIKYNEIDIVSPLAKYNKVIGEFQNDRR